jgi:hypothetical protein
MTKLSGAIFSLFLATAAVRAQGPPPQCSQATVRWGRTQLRIRTPLLQDEFERFGAAPPVPVATCSVDRQVRENHVADVLAVKHIDSDALVGLRITELVNRTRLMSPSVSVPIISAADEDVRMQLVTVTFSVGFPADALSTIASSPVSITESEITTFLEETTSVPSEFTPLSRSE